MSWDCNKIGCPFDNGEECGYEKKSRVLVQVNHSYPYIKDAFDEVKKCEQEKVISNAVDILIGADILYSVNREADIEWITEQLKEHYNE